MDAGRQTEHKLPRKPNESNKQKQRPNTKTKKPPVLPVLANQKPSVSRKNAGTNWSGFLAAVSAAEAPITFSQAVEASKPPVATEAPAQKSKNRRRKDQRFEIVAMDCEMVGGGPNRSDDMLARVSIVKKNGEVLMDKYVKPREPVTDYRTSVSGIRPQDVENGEPFEKVQDEVVDILQGKILVGHGINNDLAVLKIKHPYMSIRDTSRYKPLSSLVSNGRTPSLKRLSQAILGIEIQTGEHNSVEDARAAMSIYNRLSVEWEKYILKKRYSRK